jgi:dihydroorotate dehydrogenase (fumarate)
MRAFYRLLGVHGPRAPYPLVASESPLLQTVDGVRRLTDADVGAIVLHSLFEEQLREEAELNARLADAGTESFAESLSYFPEAAEEDNSPRRHLSLVERAAAAVDVPVIASLNCITPGGWTDYACAMQDAGPAAIELNIYSCPATRARQAATSSSARSTSFSASRTRSPCR